MVLTVVLASCAWRPPLDAYQRLATNATPSAGFQVRFLGATSMILSDAQTTLVFDGFVTRPDAVSVVFGHVASDPAMVAEHVTPFVRGRLSAVFVSHTHYDHALDAANVAGAEPPLFGPEDLSEIVPPHRAVTTLTDRTLHLGDFDVTAFPTDHSPRDLAAGRMTRRLPQPARSGDYKTGQNYAFLVRHGECRILLVTSAGEIGSTFKNVKADIVFLSVGHLGGEPKEAIGTYWANTVGAVGAKVVVPTHWDDFTQPLSVDLVAMPYLVDRVDLALDALVHHAEGVEMRLPRGRDIIDFSGTAAGERCGA